MHGFLGIGLLAIFFSAAAFAEFSDPKCERYLIDSVDSTITFRAFAEEVSSHLPAEHGEILKTKIFVALGPHEQTKLFQLHYSARRIESGKILILPTRITFSAEAAELLDKPNPSENPKLLNSWVDVLTLFQSIRGINMGLSPLESFNLWELTFAQQFRRIEFSRKALPVEFQTLNSAELQASVSAIVWREIKPLYERGDWKALSGQLAFADYFQYAHTSVAYLEGAARSPLNYFTGTLDKDARTAFKLLGKLAGIRVRLAEVRGKFEKNRFEALDAEVEKQMSVLFSEIKAWLEGEGWKK